MPGPGYPLQVRPARRPAHFGLSASIPHAMFPYKETFCTFETSLVLALSMFSKFDVLFLENARKFLGSLDEKTVTKILFNIERARFVNDPKLFKKLTTDIWEFRTRFNGIQYRLLAFWDKTEKSKTLVIAAHGFSKKTSKVELKELVRAMKIREAYFEQKQ